MSQVVPQLSFNKIIWIFWSQGWEAAPWLVRKCLASWQTHNPKWDVRVLDAETIQEYIDLPDLSEREITHASMSDILRILLLREYGGVWVDATVFCHCPLDDWLPSVMEEGFFAFDRPGPDRMLSSWFLAAAEGNALVARWHTAVLNFWTGRRMAESYFWFHYLFGDLYDALPEFRAQWDRVPKISADGPHALQKAGLVEGRKEIIEPALATIVSPVSKLTYRFRQDRLSEDSLLSRLFSGTPDPALPLRGTYPSHVDPLVSLKVGTKNLGDHIQVLAARNLVERISASPAHYIDRDNEIGSCPVLPPATDGYPMVINGWFKTNGAEWPPGEALDPVFIGFHIRLFQCPELVAPAALDYYRRHGPIGCRDQYTYDLLKGYGVDVYLSHCLTLTFSKRALRPEQQTEVFVVSRDDRIMSALPSGVSGAHFVSHYVKDTDFEANMSAAAALLERYRSRAKLIITTLLHCALPAMAMGIPVVMIYPFNTEAGHASDTERFSSLATLLPIHSLDDLSAVDWNPMPVNLSAVKLSIHDALFSQIRRWNLPFRNRLPDMAPASALQP